jgi:hypothetical protein
MARKLLKLNTEDADTTLVAVESPNISVVIVLGQATYKPLTSLAYSVPSAE